MPNLLTVITIHKNHETDDRIVSDNIVGALEEVAKTLGPITESSRVTARDLIEGRRVVTPASSGYALYYRDGRAVVSSARQV